MGEPGNEYTLNVTKDRGGVSESLKQPVTIHLKVGAILLDAMVLNEENGWQVAFTQLPDPAT